MDLPTLESTEEWPDNWPESAIKFAEEANSQIAEKTYYCKWFRVEDDLPELGIWVIGRKANKRPYVCRWLKGKGPFGILITECVDREGNLRDPDQWQAIAQ